MSHYPEYRSVATARRSAMLLRCCAPFLVLSAAALLSLFALPKLATGTKSTVVAAAILIDCTVVAPGLVYLLLVRPRLIAWTAVVPTFVLGYVVATVAMPAEHGTVAEAARLIAVPAEIGLVAYVILRTRRALARVPEASGDVVSRFRRTARHVIGSRMPADILTTEVMLLYYAFRWPRRSAEPQGIFTMHRNSGYVAILAGLAIALVVETVALHLLIRQWNPTVAYVLTGLSLYAVVWLVGDYRAIVDRGVRLGRERLFMRVGLRWDAEVPRREIAAVEMLPARLPPAGDHVLVATVVGSPNVRIRLERPTEVVGMYGLRRTATEIWLRVDDAEQLCSRIHQSGADDSRGVCCHLRATP